VSDRRYSTAAWQRVRRAVLRRDGHVCQVEGPRCLCYATTVHHLIPSSQAPHLFRGPTNLVAACGRCNYGGGARIAAENKRTTIA
jgi:5-methylcytosine-specific restriction protein A